MSRPPFWALDPNTNRARARAAPFIVRVRNGKAVGLGDVEGRVPWLQLWTALVQEFAHHLPDADGNSFSARFRGFLRSTSLPLKATIYAEWHDDRLVPWAHFVPLDNTFRDLYRVLNFFADGPGGPGDAAAASIAKRGRLWAEKVLRREDMRLYVWRLLLEWARVCDENRHRLGFVGDLTPRAPRKWSP